MTSSSLLRKIAGVTALAVCLGAAPAFADTVFSDGTFNLANYTTTSYSNDVAASLTASQCASCGNPGQAVQFNANAPNTNDTIEEALINTSFIYDPSSSGAIASIDFSVDKNIVFNQSTDPSDLFGNSAHPTIEQDGVYYIATIAGPGTTGGGVPTGFNTFTADLTAANFVEIDFATGVENTSEHPNFDGDTMTFGLTQVYGIGSIANIVSTATYDNLSYDIAPAPESSSLLMLGLGLASLLFLGLLSKKALPSLQ